MQLFLFLRSPVKICIAPQKGLNIHIESTQPVAINLSSAPEEDYRAHATKTQTDLGSFHTPMTGRFTSHIVDK